jgi:hypothetical protein
MSRRTHDAVRFEAIIAERTGVLAQVVRHREGVSTAVRAGRLSEADAALINRNVAAFAEGCAIGLHVDAETPIAVRDALRPLMKALHDGARR